MFLVTRIFFFFGYLVHHVFRLLKRNPFVTFASCSFKFVKVEKKKIKTLLMSPLMSTLIYKHANTTYLYMLIFIYYIFLGIWTG